jgi:hypothetical protein
MDDRDRTAHRQLIDSSRHTCETSRELIARAHETIDRARASVRATIKTRDDYNAVAALPRD